MHIFIISIFITGLSGIVAEILLIRELLTIFEGNELSLGIIIANWLVIQAVGSYVVAKKFEYYKEKVFIFILLQILFSLSFFLSIFLARTIKHILKIPFGSTLGINLIFFITTIVLFFPGLLHGTLFTLSAKILQENNKNDLIDISNTYIYEILGTIFGAIFFTYFLIKYFNSFQICNIILILNFTCCILIFTYYKIKNKKILILTTILFFIFIGTLSLKEKLEKISLFILWEKQNLVYNTNSIYHNIAVVEQNKQYNIFVNSDLILSIPQIDKISIEELVHIPVSLIDSYKRALIINRGLGGIIFEFLKYKNLIVDYVEMDPEIINVTKKFSDEVINEELSSSNVNCYTTDAVYFIKNTNNIYDIILIGFLEPKDLKTNRFFTYEFFKFLNKKISKNGILVMKVSGSSVYISKEMAKFNKSIINTANKIFKYVYVIPAEYNIILCSNQNFVNNLNVQKIISKLKKRNIKVDFLNYNYLTYRLNQQRINWFYENLKDVYIKINYDFLPSVVNYTLQYWSFKVSPYMYFISKKFTNIFYLIIFLILIFIFLIRIKSSVETATIISCFSNGYVSMLLYMIIILSFQILYGYIYYKIGLLTSSFMLGSIIGTKISLKHKEKIKLLHLEFFALALSVFIFLIIKIIKIFNYEINQTIYSLFPYLFLLLSLISGTLSGLSFPLYNKILLENFTSNISSIVGKVYAFDLFGGWLSAIFGSIVIFPNFGIKGIFFTILIIKLISIITVSYVYFYEKRRI